jgi:hypothetical protein
MAQYFLSSHKHGLHIDYQTCIRHMLARPPAKFVSCLYQLLLDREETPQELAEAVKDLQRGVAPGYLIHKLATSVEAKQRGLSTAWWLTRAMAAAGVPNVILDLVPAAPPRRFAGLRSRLARIPLLGKATRYLKRLILLPWNFAKLYHAVFEQQHSTRELLQTHKRELNDALNQQARELRTMMGAQINDLRGKIARVQTPSETSQLPKRERNAA